MSWQCQVCPTGGDGGETEAIRHDITRHWPDRERAYRATTTDTPAPKPTRRRTKPAPKPTADTWATRNEDTWLDKL